MNLKDIWLYFGVNAFDQEISFLTKDTEGSEWWIGGFKWGGDNLFKTMRQAIIFAERICITFNASQQKGK